MIRAGFGLRNPDRDGKNSSIGTVKGRVFYANDARAMKPVMSVLYAGSNLALHAFRAGTSVATNISTACGSATAEIAGRDCGGEELWAYLPYDQLDKLAKRYVNNPQKRDPHDYVMARAVRFSDIFVPTPGTAANPDDTPVSKTVGGMSLGQIKGVWRKVLFVGRGKGGKYLTAIDVTAPACSRTSRCPTTSRCRSSSGAAATPTPRTARSEARRRTRPSRSTSPTTRRWARPGRCRGGFRRPQHDARRRRAEGDRHHAQAQGQRLRAVHGLGLRQDRRGHELLQHRPADGRHHHARGRRHGRRCQLPDARPKRHGLRQRARRQPVVFNASRFLFAQTGVPSPNVAAAPGRRVYIADLWGRQWKFLTAAPDKPLPGRGPGHRPAGGYGERAARPAANDPGSKPHVYVTSGNENRAPVPNGQFKNFGFRDDGTDTSLTVSPAVTQNGIQVFPRCSLSS
jgi:hypothetical protein